MSYRISQLIKIFLRWPILSIWHSLEEGIWVVELLLSVSPVVIFSIANWYKMSQPTRLHHHWISGPGLILWKVLQKNFRRQRVWRTQTTESIKQGPCEPTKIERRSLQVSAPICLYVFWCELGFLVGLLNVGVGVSLSQFFLLLGYFSSCWVTLYSLVTRFFSLSYCIIIFIWSHLVVISCMCVFFCWNKKRSASKREGRWGDAELFEGRENCCWDVLYGTNKQTNENDR